MHNASKIGHYKAASAIKKNKCERNVVWVSFFISTHLKIYMFPSLFDSLKRKETFLTSSKRIVYYDGNVIIHARKKCRKK